MYPTKDACSGLRISLYVASGEMTQERCHRLALMIEHLAQHGWQRWVLDFSAVTHVDFRGMEALGRVARGLERRAGRLLWCGLSPYLRSIARVAGEAGRPSFRGRPEAMQALSTPFAGA